MQPFSTPRLTFPRLALAALFLAAACSDDVSSSPWALDEPAPQPSTPDEAPDVDEPDITPVPDRLADDLNPIWTGAWLVDQPAHALYEATVYDFQPDGTLVQGESLFFDSGVQAEVGVVGKCVETYTEEWEECATNGSCETRQYTHCVNWDPICTFGDRWGSRDERTLLIEGDCTDGTPHVIELTFPPDADLVEGAYLVPERIEVEGEEWEHNWWEWAWHRCPSPDECLPPFD